MFLDVGCLLGSISDQFSIILVSFLQASFSHRFVINLGMNFGINFDVLLIPLPFAYATIKTKKIYYTMNLYVFTHQKNIMLDDFYDVFDTHIGIDIGCVVASIMSPFWYPFGINVRVFGCSFLI